MIDLLGKQDFKQALRRTRAAAASRVGTHCTGHRIAHHHTHQFQEAPMMIRRHPYRAASLAAFALWSLATLSLPTQAQTARTTYTVGATVGTTPKDLSGFKSIEYVQTQSLNNLGQTAGAAGVYLGDKTVLDPQGYGTFKWVKVRKTSTIALSWAATGGAATRLKPLSGSINARADDINDTGWVAGTSMRNIFDAQPSATLWRNGKPTDLGAGQSSRVAALNNAGWVLGGRPIKIASNYYVTQNFLWHDNKIEVLPLPAGWQSPQDSMNCDGLSDAGAVLCSWRQSETPERPETQGTLLWQNGKFTFLSHPDHQFIDSQVISANGLVAGRVYNPYQPADLFIWRDGQPAVTVLANATFSGNRHVETVVAVNDNGAVLGWWEPTPGAYRTYGVWTATGMIDLNKATALRPGEEISYVYDMNNKGQVLAELSGSGSYRLAVLNPSQP
jgi:uncharacterized membrane protein